MITEILAAVIAITCTPYDNPTPNHQLHIDMLHSTMADHQRCSLKNGRLAREYKKAWALQKQGKQKQALEKFIKIAEDAPGFCDVHEVIGDIHGVGGCLSEAVKWYGKSLQVRPDNPEAHRKIADSYLLLGDTATALSHYENAIRFDYANPLGFQAIGSIYYSQGHPSTALHFLKRALELYTKGKNTQSEGVRLTIGLCYFQMQECDSVITYLEKMGALEHPLAYRALGDCYARRGDADRSDYYFNEADKIQGVIPMKIRMPSR